MDWSYTSLDTSVEEKPSEWWHFAQIFLLQHIICYQKCEHSSLSFCRVNLDCIVNCFWWNAIPELFGVFLNYSINSQPHFSCYYFSSAVRIRNKINLYWKCLLSSVIIISKLGQCEVFVHNTTFSCFPAWRTLFWFVNSLFLVI